ncbi:MAG: adenylate/guanylate cyclase domain-containing protein [Methylocystaceae bacterium]|nr:adenylate/guanylate cyclase domain-containing protein [Methylocystaceae bacterium]
MGTNDNQSYEVQVYHHDRWQVHARYPFHERAVAIREAKELSKERNAIPVRVIMEDYNPTTGRHSEVFVYRNGIEPGQKKSPKLNTRSGTNWASGDRVGYQRDDITDYDFDDYIDPFDPVEKPKANVNVSMFLAIISAITVIGFGSGGAAAGLLALLMHAFDVTLAPNIQKGMYIGMFVTVFLIATLSSISYYTARFNLNPFHKKPKKTPVVKKSKISKEMEKAAEAIDKMPVVETSPPEETEFTFLDGNMSVEIVEEEDEIAFSEEAQNQKMFLINFLGVCMGALKGGESNIQTLNRFGLNLFMSGAVVRLCNEHDLSEDETDNILRRILEMLGASSVQADRFALEYEKYLEDPRHAELFNRSGDIAVRYSDGDQAAPLYIRETIEDWINWKSEEEQNFNPNMLVIMFTDMVGSTDLTTKHGDYAAQEVLKAHDMIVRTALTNFEGTEIKHLGDGIMASFKKPNLALQAAIEIQKRVQGNNRSGPEFPLHVRIGLNSGEPIKKNNDLFGKSVQLAARICDMTSSDRISISHYLKDLFGEKPVYTFEDLGLCPLKGFEEPQQVYNLNWEAPPLAYEDEDESDEIDTSEEGNETHVAPDMAVIPVKKEIADTGFAQGLHNQKPAPAKPAPAPTQTKTTAKPTTKVEPNRDSPKTV